MRGWLRTPRPNDASERCWYGLWCEMGGRRSAGGRQKGFVETEAPVEKRVQRKVLVCAREFLGVIYSSENGVWLFTS